MEASYISKHLENVVNNALLNSDLVWEYKRDSEFIFYVDRLLLYIFFKVQVADFFCWHKSQKINPCVLQRGSVLI